MNADVAVADLSVWVTAHGISIAAAGTILLTAALLLRSPTVRLRRVNAQLRADLAAAQLVIAQERATANGALRLALHARRQARQAWHDLDTVRDALQAIHDDDVLARLDQNTDWQVRP